LHFVKFLLNEHGMVWYGVTVVLCRYDLMRKCWTLEPSDRPTFTECCHHIRNMILLDHSALCSVNHLPQSPYFFRSGTDLMSLLICCYCACAWWGESLKRSLYICSVVLKFGRIVLQVSVHRPTGDGFSIWRHTQSRWRPWRHFMQKSAATWWVAPMQQRTPVP